MAVKGMGNWAWVTRGLLAHYKWMPNTAKHHSWESNWAARVQMNVLRSNSFLDEANLQTAFAKFLWLLGAQGNNNYLHVRELLFRLSWAVHLRHSWLKDGTFIQTLQSVSSVMTTLSHKSLLCISTICCLGLHGSSDGLTPVKSEDTETRY